jgi:hypothetical protein
MPVTKTVPELLSSKRKHLDMNADSEIKGYIGHYRLVKWWLETFTDDEKKYIVNRYRKYHPRSGPDSLLEGKVYIFKSSTASQYLNFLTSIFQKPDENSIARKISKKSLELATYLPDLDNALLWTIRLNYKARNTVTDALDISIDACLRQIKIAPEVAKQHKSRYPTLTLGKHEGFTQLVKILEKQGNYSEVIRLAREAKKEGWEGDWDLRIERCQKRIKNRIKKSKI